MVESTEEKKKIEAIYGRITGIIIVQIILFIIVFVTINNNNSSLNQQLRDTARNSVDYQEYNELEYRVSELENR